MDVIVAYDVATDTAADQRRLRRVAKICESYGIRVQDSVFECRISNAAMAQLRIDLDDVLDQDRDSVYVYRLHGTIRDARTVLGRSRPHEFGDAWIL